MLIRSHGMNHTMKMNAVAIAARASGMARISTAASRDETRPVKVSTMGLLGVLDDVAFPSVSAVRLAPPRNNAKKMIENTETMASS